MKKTYLLLIVITILCFPFVGCTQKNKTSEIQEAIPTMKIFLDQTPLSIDEIETWAQTKIPKTALNVQTHTQHSMDSAIYIKFNLLPSELDAFLSSAGFSQLEANYWPFYNIPLSWWPQRNDFVDKPGKIFSGAKLNLMEQRFAKFIGVDMTDPELYTIYLLCFEV